MKKKNQIEKSSIVKPNETKDAIVFVPFNSVAIAPLRSEDVSTETLLAAAGRMHTFLTALQLFEGLFERLKKAGMTRKELADAWSLLQFEVIEPAKAAPKKSAEGIHGCEELLATAFPLAHGKVSLRFPDQASFLFGGLNAEAKGVEAVMTVEAFVERIRALRTGPDRAATREKDHEALAELASVGIDDASLAALDRFCAIARTIDDAPSGPTWQEQRRIALMKIHTWITVWSEQARRVLGRADLIHLGISRRRARKRTKAALPVPPVVPAAPPVATPATTPLVALPAGVVPVRPIAPALATRTAPAIEEEKGPDSRAA